MTKPKLSIDLVVDDVGTPATVAQLASIGEGCLITLVCLGERKLRNMVEAFRVTWDKFDKPTPGPCFTIHFRDPLGEKCSYSTRSPFHGIWEPVSFRSPYSEPFVCGAMLAAPHLRTSSQVRRAIGGSKAIASRTPVRSAGQCPVTADRKGPVAVCGAFLFSKTFRCPPRGISLLGRATRPALSAPTVPNCRVRTRPSYTGNRVVPRPPPLFDSPGRPKTQKEYPSSELVFVASKKGIPFVSVAPPGIEPGFTP